MTRHRCADFVLLCATTTAASAATLTGSVQDGTGAAIGSAIVIAVDNQADFRTAIHIPGPVKRTDRFGNFTLSLGAGFYDLCAFSAGFTASCQKVYVRESDRHLRRKIKLSVDPVVMKERGDVFQ